MASHQARPGGTLYIFTGPGLASRRWSRLNSNVRPHNPRPNRSTRLTLSTQNVIIAARAYQEFQVQRHPSPLRG